MKDQYFGDFGDYQKIYLLKFLSKDTRIIVHWMKTHDDGGTDGKHIAYLQKPEIWRSFEPDIFDFLSEKITTKKRSLSHIESSLYDARIRFIASSIEHEEDRKKILASICNNQESELVFFDPDNGIEVSSTNKRNIHKYVTWKEIEATFDSGKSVMVYQHFSRVAREKFVAEIAHNIRERIKAPVVLAVRVKHSAYFFILHKKHVTKVKKALNAFAHVWKDLAILQL